MKIKFKLTLAITSILVILGIALNISIKNVLTTNMEITINNSLKEIMNSTRESVKYRLTLNDSLTKEDLLSRESDYLIKYISLNYECMAQLNDINGNMISTNITGFPEEIAKGIISSKTGQATSTIKYTKSGITSIISYPIYINGRYLAILNIAKDYNETYLDYTSTINFITVIELIIFFIMFLLSYFMTNNITKPISALTEAVKEISNGNYNIPILSKGKDEVSILSSEFIKMKDKISEQINTIEAEKDKVYTLEKSRKLFFDNVTHEIKTPLTTITGYAEMIKDNISDDEDFKQRAIERIHSESERLNLLILDLMEVSKGLSTIKENKVEINIESLIKQVCDDMKIKANKYSLTINISTKPGLLFGQINKLRELLINIIDNAIKYTTGNTIKVNSICELNYYYIYVENESNPIPYNIYNSIFEPFVKINDSKENQSLGLGLYLCNEIIKEHNGEINITNGDLIIVEIKIPYSRNNLDTTI
ncbi:sensor histidine kinase [Clostridium gasigenes]|uniref:sensor histidine kinase n=1 Tax=Clostridium gasigenes TaxID=94869 RepID=UPI001C0B1B05|nr:HAMP domain-containing sensor histidine kinase [Clostridium gasigenes]MBU3108849.1 HAMP domain-containing histidine kinase [Clostridium gasigenes]